LQINSDGIPCMHDVVNYDTPRQGHSGAGTWRSAVTENIFEPERRISKWCLSQIGSYY